MSPHAEAQGRITVEDLCLTFPGRETVVALENITFEVSPQEFVCLLGPSGCGKSSVLNVIAGFISPTSGTVGMDGNEIEGPGPDRGVVFQHYGLFPWKTVRDNIRFGPRMLNTPRVEVEALYNHYLDVVGLRGFENKYPFELSGGMQQRVGIARALANDPMVLLMDEPFGALDAQTRLVMQETLLDIWEQHKKTIIFVTHDVDESLLLSDRILVMTARPGKIKKEISVPLLRPRPYEILADPCFVALKAEVMALIKEEITLIAELTRVNQTREP